MNRPRIRTDFVHPPIPIRTMDWQAVYDDDEPDDEGRMDVGHGATEAEAIADLIESHPREEEPSPENFEQTFGCLGCTCRMETVNSASIDPPEPIRDRNCPHHGSGDPDYARDLAIEDRQHGAGLA